MIKYEDCKIVIGPDGKPKFNVYIEETLITLLYPLNGIKFTTSKTRNSQDFINHLNSIKRYVKKRNIKRFILVIDNASFHVSKKTKQFIERQSEDWLTVLFLHQHMHYS